MVDVTATQFDSCCKAVEVRPVEEATDDLWQPGVKLRTLEEVRKYLKHWPDYQPLRTRS